MLRRAQHWTDTPRAGFRQRSRRIQNWSNRRTAGGLWFPTVDEDPRAPSGVPDDWPDSFDFAWQRLDAPLQTFGGDTAQPDNQTLVGARLSSEPSSWFRMRALNLKTLGVAPTLLPGERGLRWGGIWPRCALRWVFGRHSITKTIRVNQPGVAVPDSFRFALILAPSLEHEIVGKRIVMRRKEDGSEVFVTRPVHGLDADGNHIRVQLSEGVPTQGGRPTFVLTPNPNDMSNAIYPADIDPTTVISGTSDIEEADLRLAGPDNNFGGWTAMRYESGRNVVARILTSAIPSGTIDEVRITHKFALASSPGTAHRILPGNEWVEGSSINAPEAGAACWNWRKYNTAAWLGSSGCNTPSTDYEATSMGSIVGGTGGSTQVSTLDSHGNVVFENWKSGAYTNEGFTMRLFSGTRWHAYSSEDATAPWYFEIDYTAGLSPSGFPRHFTQRRR